MAGSQTVAKAARRAPGGIGFFERYLSLWVALCIVVGIVLGKLLPGAVHTVSMLELAHVNIPVGILIWVMIIPMLLRIDFASLGKVRTQLRGIGVTLVINWAVKPFTMAFLAWVFVRHAFASLLPADQ
jgi:ACR3 family arsenite transporter